MAGLVGFFFYALGQFVRRYLMGDLGYLLLVSLFQRAVSVLFIGPLLSGIESSLPGGGLCAR